jgi:lipopolysaccharide export system permease protein
MLLGSLSRYIVRRFFFAVVTTFGSIMLIVLLADYVETARRTSGTNVPPGMVALLTLCRVPQITEGLMPFSVLIGTMVAYLGLSRRNELVVARAAGISAWQLVMPAALVALCLGMFATGAYNPLATHLAEQAKRIDAAIFDPESDKPAGRFWLRQRSGPGQSIISATTSRGQGEGLLGVTALVFDEQDHFKERIEADAAALEPGYWRFTNARVYTVDAAPQDVPAYVLQTNLTRTQIRESFATPETVSFWQLPTYIDLAERAGLVAAGYRLQYQVLLARPFLLAGMALLASSLSLGFFRMGGVGRMVLAGVGAGFLLYILSKVFEDLGSAKLVPVVVSGWVPAVTASLTGIMILLHQEDG